MPVGEVLAPPLVRVAPVVESAALPSTFAGPGDKGAEVGVRLKRVSPSLLDTLHHFCF